eukprot:TRINITY_DN5727_c2_g1_i1.p1 TRINITY_DN5727_c2_g1~~TRINITY_DN5727_c2_g1_i1.p1  ORF type:complete len:778 (-),score=103.49 TRINITY_DN5727_c2_g1_i1:69-2402(-)
MAAQTKVLSIRNCRCRSDAFAVATVADQDFPGEYLEILIEANSWSVGDDGILLPLGTRVSPSAVSGHWSEKYLSCRGWEVHRIFIGDEESQGILLQLGLGNSSLPSCMPTNMIDILLSTDHPRRVERRVVIEFSFDGSDFRGSEVSDCASVGGSVRDALLCLGVIPAGREKSITRSKRWQSVSRTDAGVHARSFVLALPSLSLNSQYWRPGPMQCEEFRAALNAALPSSIRAIFMWGAPYSAQLRSVATEREYCYYLPRTILGAPAGGSTEEATLSRVLQHFKGESSFANFTDIGQCSQLERFYKGSKHADFIRRYYDCRRRRRETGYAEGTQVDSTPLKVPAQLRFLTKRTVLAAELAASPDEAFLCLRIVASGFLYNMVRLLVGTACAVACGFLDEQILLRALAAEDIVDLTEFKACAAGLVLHRQHFDLSRAGWLTAPGGDYADQFLHDVILPAVKQSWLSIPALYSAPPPRRRQQAEDSSDLQRCELEHVKAEVSVPKTIAIKQLGAREGGQVVAKLTAQPDGDSSSGISVADAYDLLFAEICRRGGRTPLRLVLDSNWSLRKSLAPHIANIGLLRFLRDCPDKSRFELAEQTEGRQDWQVSVNSSTVLDSSKRLSSAESDAFALITACTTGVVAAATAELLSAICAHLKRFEKPGVSSSKSIVWLLKDKRVLRRLHRIEVVDPRWHTYTTKHELVMNSADNPWESKLRVLARVLCEHCASAGASGLRLTSIFSPSELIAATVDALCNTHVQLTPGEPGGSQGGGQEDSGTLK